MSALTPQEVTRYYRWLLNREPEPEILAQYETSGIRRFPLIAMIVDSDEFKDRMRRVGVPDPACIPPLAEDSTAAS